ncbi:asparagine synthase (glutamine-hydrolyzing) [Granulosicoccus sp.]|nr:asparagine synthase (glutamine-hydrolyzing) [Granulosicoccus sp.]
MCGIAGLKQPHANNVDTAVVLERMGNAIRHRGPDNAGQYIDEAIGLCHQRLSIIDTSDHGLQPMTSPSGRFITVYNGEIYNFLELRRDLEEQGVQFRGTSDTEVLLALYETEGTAALQRLNGMFAMAIWDTQNKSLFLARDRLGKKPLYYYTLGNQFGFASEIKALLQIPGIDRTLRMDAVKDFFTYQYVPDPKSIFAHIHKLPPGHCMTADANGIKLHQYWNVSFATQYTGTEEQARADLYALLDDSVRIRMISDVPLGAFLSGGVDSSGVVGLMAANSDHPVTTCAVGFDQKEFDETKYAQQVAKRFSTDHHRYTVSDTVEQSLVKVATYFDEPFADASFMPTYFVSRTARQHVTVALAGDGGDENFAGYTKYKTNAQEQRRRVKVPDAVRHGLLSPLSGLMSGRGYRHMQRASNLFRSLSATPAEGYFLCNSFFRKDIWDTLATGTLAHDTSDYSPSQVTTDHYNAADTDDHLARTLYTDIKSYLPGDILTKVDRMSMANSLECRAPLLDYRVVEFAASLPSSLKLNNGESKYILKKAFSPLLTDDILYRRKMGFSSPIAHWLRHELRNTFERHVFADDAASRQFFHLKPLKALWQAHLGGSDIAVNELWSILMFEIWWQAYVLRTS